MSEIYPSSVYPGGILTLDQSLQISLVSPEFGEIFDCQPEEIIGQRLENLFSPKDRKGTLVFHNKLSRYENGFIDVIILLQIKTKEFITRLRVIKQQEQWFAIVEDILSESDDLFREFHIGKERWTSIVRNSSEGIAMLDAEGRLVEFNSRFLEMMQFRSTHGVLLNEDAIFNKNIFDLLEHAQFKDVYVAFEKSKSKKKVKFKKEVFYNQHYLKLELTPIYFPVQGFVGCSFVVKDITAEKKLQAAHQEIIHINQVAKTVNSSLNLDQVITSINESLQTFFAFDQITIALLDQEQKNLCLYRAYQVQGNIVDLVNLEEISGQTIKPYNISLSQHQNYWVKTIVQNQPIYIVEFTPELALPQEVLDQTIETDDLSIPIPKSAIFYPLEVQDRVFGVLSFAQYHQTFNLTQEQILKIQNYVVQIATAINNAKLYEDLRATKIQLAETEKIVALSNQLREKEKEYRNLVENINLGVYRNSGDSNGRILKANQALVRMFGYASAEELMQIPLPQLYVNSEDRTEFIKVLQQQGECRNFELHLKKKDGTPMLASVNATVQYDSQGNLKWYDGVIEDITERKKAEETLKKLKVTFEHFVPQQFLNRIAKEGVENIELGKAESEIVTILFSDIRSFTTLSETIPPQKLLNFLNTYFQYMNEVIHSHQGFIDKFVGDGIMALFDSRGEAHQSIHAGNAVQTAIQMIDVLKVYNKHQMKLGYPPISIGIGIHTGSVIIGTVGSQDRMDSTVLGDSVNLASRLEALTKSYGVNIIMSEETFGSLENPQSFRIRVLDWVRVRGRKKPTRLFEVFNADTPELQAKKQQTQELIVTGLNYRTQQLWQEAITCFQRILEIDPNDKLGQFHLQQCQRLRQVELPPNWDGAIDLG